jgi:hypothetical protein
MSVQTLEVQLTGEKSEEGKENGKETHFCGRIVCVVEAGGAQEQ